MVLTLDELSKQQKIEIPTFFDERAASFFALGRIKRDKKPVVVIVTSGTAVAELFPAIMEAFYSSLPLIVITADRPKTYRGSGAPQSINQLNIFGEHAKTLVDLDETSSLENIFSLWNKKTPTQLNICFEEPLIKPWQKAHIFSPPQAFQAPVGQNTSVVNLQNFKRPLVIVGNLDSHDRPAVTSWLESFRAPVLCEASSGIREKNLPFLMRSGEKFLTKLLNTNQFDSLIRIGDIPSFRLWRDIEEKKSLPVLNLSNKPWAGLSGRTVVQGDLPLLIEKVLTHQTLFSTEELNQWHKQDSSLWENIQKLLIEFPQSEAGIIHQLSQSIPEESLVYLGNSLPIREWNEFAQKSQKHFELFENRGVNGIDGQLSTFLGLCQNHKDNWAIVGDLTALYDLQSLWAKTALPQTRFHIVVINNGGGQIFDKLFGHPLFLNAHEVRFEAWAKMWKVDYQTSLPSTNMQNIIELIPDDKENHLFHEKLKGLYV